MNSSVKWTVVALAVAALSACGGGRDDPLPTDPSTDAVAKYVGSWISDCVEEDGASAQARADFSKSSANGLTGEVIVNAYVGKSCSGPSVRDRKVLSDLSITLTGSSTVAGLAADQFEGSSAQGEGKILLAVSGASLYVGDPDTPDDAKGFPTGFFEYVLKRLN